MNAKPKNLPTALPDPDDAPELTETFFDQADEYVGDKLVRRGRPPVAEPKQQLTIRLDAHVIERWRASGKGWQTRAAALLARHAP